MERRGRTDRRSKKNDKPLQASGPSSLSPLPLPGTVASRGQPFTGNLVGTAFHWQLGWEHWLSAHRGLPYVLSPPLKRASQHALWCSPPVERTRVPSTPLPPHTNVLEIEPSTAVGVVMPTSPTSHRRAADPVPT